MKSFFSFFSLAAIILCLNTNLLSQVNIIPVRTDVTGFASWTDTDVTGTNYVQLLKATSKTISPAMDFTAYINESLSFSARTYGGVNATENVITVSISVDNGGTWTVLGTRTPTSTTMTAQADFDLSSYNGTQVKLKFSVAGTNNTVGSGIDDITITGYPPTAPTITVNPATLGGMNYVFENGPSAEQSFVIYGTNLIANISINAPTNYQISTTSGSGFTNSLTLTQSAGSVLNTTIFVRLNAGLSVATYNGQIINALSSGATTQTVTCNGIVTNPTDPAIPTSLFEIQNILVDACAGSVEGQNEMVIFQVGATSINVTDLRVDGAGASGVIENGKWPNPSNLWRGISPPPSNPADIAFVNSTITSCGFLIEPVGGILPAGKKVLMITSTAWDRTAHSFASLQDTLYVIFQNAGNTAGHFVNHGTSSERTFVLRHVPSGYGDTIIYNRSFLVTQLGIQGPEDGGAVAYTWNGTATYYNNGCQAPYIPMDPSWNFNSPSICETDAAINLNALITGTAGGVWSGTGVSGNTFDPDGLSGSIAVTYTLGTAPCDVSEMHSIIVNLNTTPLFTALGPYCVATTPASLPTTSTNSITGTWSPATISTVAVGTTVYTFTPTAGQCALSTTMSVTINAANITPSFTALGPYCVGASPASLPTTSTNSISGTWSPATISTATVGTTVYTFTPNAGQCAVTNTMSILVNSIPSISATGSNPNCFGNTDGSITVNITGGNPVFNIAWNGGSANTLSNSYLVSGLASGNYNITLTDLNNCIASATANLTQPTELTISVVSTPIGIFGGTSNVTVNASGGISPYTGTGVFNVGAGTYTYTVTDDNGCTASQTINISQPTELLISVSSTPINCYGELSEIIVSATGGVTPYLGTGTFYVSAGTYSYTITDNSGTTATATVVVGQPSEIILSEASNNALCFGGFGSANVNIISGGVAPYSILWQDNSTQFTNNNIPANTHFAYTVTDNNSCPITGSVSVSQPEELLITYTATNAGCFNSYDGSIELYSISGGTPPYNFIWNNGYTLPSLNNVPAGNYQVTVSDQNGCENIAQVEILQADEIFLSIVVTDELCSGAAGKLTATVTGGISPYTYLWNNSATTSEITNLNPGTYSLTVTDANHCTITQTANVNITGSLFPTIAITNPISCFSMSDGTLQANCPSAVLPNTYSWNNGITTAINQNLSSGNYSVVLTDSRGCSGNASINLVNPAEIKITSIITPISCNGEIDGAITVNINGGSNPYSFIWSNSETTATIENLNSGNYAISVTDSRNCIANASFSIIQPDVLYLDYQIHEIMCYGYRDGSLLLSASGGSRPYNFGLTQGTTQYNGNNHNRLTPGIYTIFVEDNNNCRISEDIVFQEPAPILASFTYSNPTCIGINNGFIEIEITGGILPYLFNWNENLTDIPLYGNLTQGEYEINIIDANDCELSLGTVKLEDTDIDCISIPNAFTPNADGINDTWIIENIEWFADAYIQVYNRWGQEIYGNKATAGNWDGTFNGKFVPTGTYLYVVELNNGIRAYTGMVSVVY